MSEKSIQRLKRKFILTAMLSFVTVMLFMSAAIYGANSVITRSEIREVMAYLISNDGLIYGESGGGAAEEASSGSSTEDADGEVSGDTSTEDQMEQPGQGSSRRETLQRQLQELFGFGSNYNSPEFFYSTRYFAVIYGTDGSVENVITSHIAAVAKDEAVQYAERVKRGWRTFGNIGDYYYQVAEQEDGSSIIVFLDCTSQVAFGRRIVYISLILIGFGMLVSWLVLRVLSGRIVQPEIHNAEMQKSFITNASHELKTPLAVIRANTELLEMTNGENEWTQSTLRQVDRMQGLIQNLVMITRAQEQDNRNARVNTDISKAVLETVKTFEPVAEQEGRKLVVQVPEGIMMNAEEGQIRQLASVLIDNAIKYCDDKGTITVQLARRGRSNIRLAVSNPYAAGKNQDYHRFFDRFYRADESHNQDKGGYGIGLSIAQNLVEQYHGTIDAAWNNGVITFTCIL